MSMRTKLDNAKFKGMIQGRRLYREKHGVWHVQCPTRPNEAEFTGTKRECERALHGSFVRVN